MNRGFPSGITQPSPELEPDQVVEILLEAFQNNDDNNGGLQTVYRFVSPNIRPYTGSFDQFVQFLRRASYSILINHRYAEVSPIHVRQNAANQRVVVYGAKGQMAVYTFILSRQKGNQYDGCWMTEFVSVDWVAGLN
jgi:hypothetical protein